MPPRRSCFKYAVSLPQLDFLSFNATTAFLLPPPPPVRRLDPLRFNATTAFLLPFAEHQRVRF